MAQLADTNVVRDVYVMGINGGRSKRGRGRGRRVKRSEIIILIFYYSSDKCGI